MHHWKVRNLPEHEIDKRSVFSRRGGRPLSEGSISQDLDGEAIRNDYSQFFRRTWDHVLFFEMAWVDPPYKLRQGTSP